MYTCRSILHFPDNSMSSHIFNREGLGTDGDQGRDFEASLSGVKVRACVRLVRIWVRSVKIWVKLVKI